MSPFVVTLIIILFSWFVYKRAFGRPKNFPPGLPSLPIWGSYWLVLALNYKFPHLVFDRLGKWYNTNMLGLYLGRIPTVVTLDYETTHEMLIRPEFENRYDNVVARMRAFGKQLGIFFVDGQFWTEQRRFSLRNMRDFGLGRRSEALETIVEWEVKDLIERISRGPRNEFESKFITNNKEMFFPLALRFGFMSSFWYVLTGSRFSTDNEHDQKWAMRAIKAAVNFQEHGEPAGGALFYTPWLRYFWPRKSGYVPLKNSHFQFLEFIEEYLKPLEETYHGEAPRGFIDIYLEQLRHGDGPNESFSRQQLLLILADCILPSIIALATSLSFIFMHLIDNPEVQEKIQQEIDLVVGPNRLPTLNDRARMPYTEATVREGLRRETLNPLGFFRKCTVDTTLGGYTIPKGTLMLPGFWSSHMDKKLWQDPENFRPERFLDPKTGQLLKKDYTIAFGGGRRLCIGETFSRHNMFIFLASLLQNFRFVRPSEHLPGPEIDYNDYINGINISPKSFWLRAIERN